MLMAQGMDTGDMLLKESVRVGENETSSGLYDRLSYVGADLLIKTLDAVEKGVHRHQNILLHLCLLFIKHALIFFSVLLNFVFSCKYQSLQLRFK